MTETQVDSIWDALEASPQEAANMRMRSSLMMALKDRIAGKGWTQAEAAKQLDVSQPRISDLVRGKINVFGLDALVSMAILAGLHVEIEIRQAA